MRAFHERSWSRLDRRAMTRKRCVAKRIDLDIEGASDDICDWIAHMEANGYELHSAQNMRDGSGHRGRCARIGEFWFQGRSGGAPSAYNHSLTSARPAFLPPLPLERPVLPPQSAFELPPAPIDQLTLTPSACRNATLPRCRRRFLWNFHRPDGVSPVGVLLYER